jgi:hypothetical protein
MSRMSAPTFPYRDTITGKIGRYTELAASTFEHRLERVSEDAKPFEPGLFRSGTVDERAVLLVDGQAPTLTASEDVEHVEEDTTGDAKAAPSKKKG